jgi:polynucleotide 5'-kinase involved in rRNA processing
MNKKIVMTSDSVLRLKSFALSGADGLTRHLKVEPLHIPPRWPRATEAILKSLKGSSSSSSSSLSVSVPGVEGVEGSASPSPYPRVLVCGAKGVGKSTCLRYTVNRLLGRARAVCVIDCDLGQPEFTVPGLLSLHLVRASAPVLSPTHLHLHPPLLSHFIGDITSKNEPELFARALASLYSRYEQLRSEYQLKDDKARSRNAFSLLDEASVPAEPLPLVVNTDGNIRYMGAEILSAVLQIVRPTRILHLSTEKDRDLPPVRDYMESKKVTEGEEEEGRDGCVLYTLEPGRLTASNIHSIDLRNLR